MNKFITVGLSLHLDISIVTVKEVRLQLIRNHKNDYFKYFLSKQCFGCFKKAHRTYRPWDTYGPAASR